MIVELSETERAFIIWSRIVLKAYREFNVGMAAWIEDRDQPQVDMRNWDGVIFEASDMVESASDDMGERASARSNFYIWQLSRPDAEFKIREAAEETVADILDQCVRALHNLPPSDGEPS